MNFGKKVTIATIALIISSILMGSLFVSAAPEDTGVGIGDYEARIAELEAEVEALTIMAGTNRELLDFLEDQWIPGPQGEQGPEGPPGPQGEQGEPGFGVDPIGYLSIPAAAFTPYYNDDVLLNLGGYVDNLDEHEIMLTAPVFLPHGVRVTNLTMYAGDAIVDQEIDCILYKGGGGGGEMASTTSIDDVLSVTYDDTILSDIIDNTTNNYYLWLYIPESGGALDLIFMWAVIEYEYIV